MGISCEAAASTKCNDGMDNDSDGKIDLADPECVHPCDNDEATFATGISGDNMDACKQDCFFDGNSGRATTAATGISPATRPAPGPTRAKACPYDADKKNCPTQQSAKCIKNCRSWPPTAATASAAARSRPAA